MIGDSPNTYFPVFAIASNNSRSVAFKSSGLIEAALYLWKRGIAILVVPDFDILESKRARISQIPDGHAPGNFDADGKYDEKCYKITFTESIKESYEMNEDMNDVKTISIDQKHFLNKRKCIYIVTKREGSWTLESSHYKEYVGNDAQPGRYKYFLGVIIIGRK